MSSDYENDKEDGDFRIVVLGDSYTARYGLREKESSYTEILERRLDMWEGKSKHGIRGFQVIPLCTDGMNTFQEITLLKEMGLSYEPDMVILQYCDNDILDDMVPGLIGENAEDGTISFNPDVRYIAVGNSIIPEMPFTGEAASKTLFNSHFMRFVSYRLNTILIMQDNSYKESFDSLRELDEITDEESIPLIIINFPYASRSHDYCSNDVGLMGKSLHMELSRL